MTATTTTPVHFRTQRGHLTVYFGEVKERPPLASAGARANAKKRKRQPPPWFHARARIHRRRFLKPRPRRPTSVPFSERAKSLRLCEPSPVIGMMYGTFVPYSSTSDTLIDADLDDPFQWLDQYKSFLPPFPAPPSEAA